MNSVEAANLSDAIYSIWLLAVNAFLMSNHRVLIVTQDSSAYQELTLLRDGIAGAKSNIKIIRPSFAGLSGVRVNVLITHNHDEMEKGFLGELAYVRAAECLEFNIVEMKREFDDE